MRCQNSKTEPFHVPLVVPGEPYASPALPAAGPAPGPVVTGAALAGEQYYPLDKGSAPRGRAQCTGCGLVRRGRRAFAGAPRPDQWRGVQVPLGEGARASHRQRRERQRLGARQWPQRHPSHRRRAPGQRTFPATAGAPAGLESAVFDDDGASGSPAAAASTVASTQPGAWWRSGPRPRARRRTASASPRTARSGTRRTTRWCMSIRSTAAPSGCPRLKARRPCAGSALHRQALGQRQRWRPAVPLRSQRCLVAELAAAGQPGPPGQPAGRRHGPCLAARRRQRALLRFDSEQVTFRVLPSDRPAPGNALLGGRPGETWSAEPAADRLRVVRD